MSKNTFPTDDFLLYNQTRTELYNIYKKKQPIIDYYCHLPLSYSYEGIQFENSTQVCSESYNYNWRVNTPNDIENKYITNMDCDFEKFQK